MGFWSSLARAGAAAVGAVKRLIGATRGPKWRTPPAALAYFRRWEVWRAVSSSNVGAFAYFSSDKKGESCLGIQFYKSRTMYTYPVPRSYFKDALGASSKGRWVWAALRRTTIGYDGPYPY
jgi:hypothetical protein